MSARPAVYLRKGSRVRLRYCFEVCIVESRRGDQVQLRPLFEKRPWLAMRSWIKIQKLVAIEESPAR
jgi:hypothetical protein